MFKTRLQCGSEQWCCSYRKKTENPLPDWVSIYFVKNSDTEYRCNICEGTVYSKKPSDRTDHIKTQHKEVYDVHKVNTETNVGFHIEFLHLDADSDLKTQAVVIGEVCEAATEEIVQPNNEESVVEEAEEIDGVVEKPKKSPRKPSARSEENRKRSWVWKYFHKMGSIIYQCSLCHVVLSIKGCNSNNMNRHIRTRHADIFNLETDKKRRSSADQLDLTEVETPYAIKTEEISTMEKETVEEITTTPSGHRRSWIWLYFDRKSHTTAQCRLCYRLICHGGNATGNMNRHLKIIHNKTADDYTWIWKVFENTEDDFYSCKICTYQCMKFSDADKSISCILQHLKQDHGVVSGDQIITDTTECETDEN